MKILILSITMAISHLSIADEILLGTLDKTSMGKFKSVDNCIVGTLKRNSFEIMVNGRESLVNTSFRNIAGGAEANKGGKTNNGGSQIGTLNLAGGAEANKGGAKTNGGHEV